MTLLNMTHEFLLLAHVTFGVIALICAGAIGFETYLTKVWSHRKQLLSWIVLFTLTISMILGGFWYLTEYQSNKIITVAGPAPWAHKIVMETKEHWFFILMLAALLLPFAVKDEKRRNGQGGQGIVMILSIIIFSLGMAMEGMGAIISMGVRLGLGGAE